VTYYCIIRQILEKKWEYNEARHQVFIDFKKACDSAKREVVYNILIQYSHETSRANKSVSK